MSFFRRLFTHGQRINDYFVNAVRVYAFLGEEPERCAALAAAKVAARKQRGTMIEYLSYMASDLKRMLQDDPGCDMVVGRLLSLKEDIEEKDWSTIDAVREKNKLEQIEPDYLAALNNADPSVFPSKHPDLFDDGT